MLLTVFSPNIVCAPAAEALSSSPSSSGIFIEIKNFTLYARTIMSTFKEKHWSTPFLHFMAYLGIRNFGGLNSKSVFDGWMRGS